MVWITALALTEIRCDTKFRFIPSCEPSSGREREVKQIEARAEINRFSFDPREGQASGAKQ